MLCVLHEERQCWCYSPNENSHFGEVFRFHFKNWDFFFSDLVHTSVAEGLPSVQTAPRVQLPTPAPPAPANSHSYLTAF